jgi:hypothetical protein
LINNSSGIEWQKAEQAVCLLEKNGWTEIPEKYLPKGYTHSDLMRHMACVSNKESTFGAAVYGPNTGCGNAFGYWQIASCHMGQSVRGLPQYRCPATNVNTLANNFDVSAQCALYVYMEAASNGRRGVAPWEATCSRSEWAANRRDGAPLFPVGCGYAKCFKNIKMGQNKSEFAVSVDKACGAASVEAVLLQANGSSIVQTGKTISGTFVASGSLKTATLSLAGAPSNFNRLRIRIKEGNRVLWTSNPSPSINLGGSSPSSSSVISNKGSSSATGSGSGSSSTSGNVEPSIMPTKSVPLDESQFNLAPIEEDPESY